MVAPTRYSSSAHFEMRDAGSRWAWDGEFSNPERVSYLRGCVLPLGTSMVCRSGMPSLLPDLPCAWRAEAVRLSCKVGPTAFFR